MVSVLHQQQAKKRVVPRPYAVAPLPSNHQFMSKASPCPAPQAGLFQVGISVVEAHDLAHALAAALDAGSFGLLQH